MKILIEFEPFPEQIKRYIVETENNELIKKIKRAHNQLGAHGQLIDGTNDSLWLYDFLRNKTPVDIEKPISLKDVDLLIISGWDLY